MRCMHSAEAGHFLFSSLPISSSSSPVSSSLPPPCYLLSSPPLHPISLLPISLLFLPLSPSSSLYPPSSVSPLPFHPPPLLVGLISFFHSCPPPPPFIIPVFYFTDSFNLIYILLSLSQYFGQMQQTHGGKPDAITDKIFSKE